MCLARTHTNPEDVTHRGTIKHVSLQAPQLLLGTCYSLPRLCYFDDKAPGLETRSDPALTQAYSIVHVKVQVAFSGSEAHSCQHQEGQERPLTLISTQKEENTMVSQDRGGSTPDGTAGCYPIG